MSAGKQYETGGAVVVIAGAVLCFVYLPLGALLFFVGLAVFIVGRLK